MSDMEKKKKEFNPKKCAIPTVYCGNGPVPKRKDNDDTYYSGLGTPYQCMQKGFGAGMHSEKNKSLPKNSVQNIKYVGEVYESNFKKRNINTIDDLVEYASSHEEKEIKKLLKKVFDKHNGILDQRAYNSTLLFLYKKGIQQLPSCVTIK